MQTFELSILEQYPDAVIFSDNEGIIRIFNEAAENVLGFSKAQAIGASLDIMIPEKLREAHWAGFEQAVQTGKLKHEGKAMKTKAQCSDGSFILLSVSFSLIKDVSGKVLGSVANCRKFEKE